MTGSTKTAPTLAKLKSPTHDRDVAVAAFLFTAVGVGYLFPFSALTQPVDYWHKMFPDFNIEFPLTTMYMWVNLIFLFLIVFFGGEPSYTFRVVGGFAGQLVVLVCVPSFYFLHLDEHTHYTYIMIATAVAAIATALVDSVAIGFAAQFPTEVQVALQFGIGFSTLIGSVYRIITKLVFPVDQVVESSLLYFYSGAATILVCIYAYYVILSLPLTQQCVSFGVQGSASPTATTAESAADVQGLLADVEVAHDGNFELSNRTRSIYSGKSPYHHKRLAGYGSVETSASEQRPDENAPVDKWELLQRVAFNEFIVFVVFFSTLLLWPPLITEIKSFDYPLLQETQWWPLILLAVFSVSDCLGRLSLPFRLGLNASNLWIAVLLRFALFPLLVCSAKGIYFTHDYFSVVFVLLLGFTNGYLGSLGILFINEQVSEQEKGVVGMFTGFFLNMGLVFGATAACFVEKLALAA
jgi:equilibrative nucleoside transporter 1/2/3